MLFLAMPIVALIGFIVVTLVYNIIELEFQLLFSGQFLEFFKTTVSIILFLLFSHIILNKR